MNIDMTAFLDIIFLRIQKRGCGVLDAGYEMGHM
jgi:hypothetical protein